MMKFILILSLILSAAIGASAKSKNSSKKSVKTVTKNVKKKSLDGQLGTEFSFDAASVRGKYQMAGQGIASIENEKVLDDLLGLRRSFRDREAQESKRW